MASTEPAPLFWWALLFFPFIVIAAISLSKAKDRTVHRAEVMREFEAWLTTSAARKFGLPLQGCEIVHEYESADDNRGSRTVFYALTLFLRNDAGNYVMYKSTQNGPYVKLVAPDVAKALLKEKYLAPPGG